MSGNRSKSVQVVITIALLLLPVINHFWPFGFFFEGTLVKDREWFPVFSFIAYIFFKIFFPSKTVKITCPIKDRFDS